MWGEIRIKKLVISAISIFVVLLAVSIIAINNEISNSVTTSASTSLSSKKIKWGIKRGTNGEQADIGSENRKLIEANEGIGIGNPEKKFVYLTFDEGYEKGYTEKILDVLKKTNVKAAFFITGHYFNSEPALVDRMIKEGHIVGNHTVNHYSMPDITDEQKLKEEVMNLHTNMFDKFNHEMKYFRPPMGEYSEKTLNLVKNLGYTTVMWSFAYEDWDVNKQGNTDFAKQKILDNMHSRSSNTTSCDIKR